MDRHDDVSTSLRGNRKMRRRPPSEDIIHYIVEIEGWDWSYWLALNALRGALDPYHEHRGLQINRRPVRPTGLKTDRIEVSLFPSASLEEERRRGA